MPKHAFEKPRPRPPKAPPAFATMTEADRKALAEHAEYVGSEHHTDIPKYGMKANPRQGAIRIEEAEGARLKNPSCTVCPRKWARRQSEASKLVQAAIENGYFVDSRDGGKPALLWARDPEDPGLVYEAKLCSPPNGYKAYPLTTFQAEYNLPFRLP